LKRLEGKVALIVGGTSGIGEATARLFAAEGSKVIVGGRNDARGRRIVGECDAEFYHMDVVNEEDVKEAVDFTVGKHGKLDCIFNNAGSGGLRVPVDTIPVDGFDKMVAVLYRGVFLGVKHAARVMKTQSGGCIINTAV